MVVDEAVADLACVHLCCVTEGTENNVANVRGLQAGIDSAVNCMP